ncbi:hypothetical protein DL764_002360 [Monosporascus ibericus]|uniref:CCHC-type domain-containing protein n=1 Tax=Monosporascus ibericus TaxID=155417 RepID=A0A4Q4TM13_9PEZI|nr:hypothetical protein DL764_002360 [Monosporascus ibericus]
MPVNSSQQVTFFFHTTRDKKREGAAGWKSRMKGTLRQHPTTTVSQVFDDFIAEFRGKESKGKKPEDKPLCWNCGEYGRMARDCPKARKNKDNDDESHDGKGQSEVHFIPDGLEDLYGQHPKKYQAGY